MGLESLDAIIALIKGGSLFGAIGAAFWFQRFIRNTDKKINLVLKESRYTNRELGVLCERSVASANRLEKNEERTHALGKRLEKTAQKVRDLDQKTSSLSATIEEFKAEGKA